MILKNRYRDDNASMWENKDFEIDDSYENVWENIFENIEIIVFPKNLFSSFFKNFKHKFSL